MEAGRVLGKCLGLKVPKQKEAHQAIIELMPGSSKVTLDMGPRHGLDSKPPCPSHELTDGTLFTSSESQHSHL